MGKIKKSLAIVLVVMLLGTFMTVSAAVPVIYSVNYVNDNGVATADPSGIIAGLKIISIKFSEAMNEASFAGNVTLMDSSSQEVSFGGTLSADSMTYTMTLAVKLDNLGDYTLQVATGVMTTNSENLASAYTKMVTIVAPYVKDYYTFDNFEGFVSNSTDGFTRPNDKWTADTTGKYVSVPGATDGTALMFSGTAMGTGRVDRALSETIYGNDNFTVEFDFKSDNGGMTLYLDKTSGVVTRYKPMYIPVKGASSTTDLKYYHMASTETSIPTGSLGLAYTYGEWAHIKIECPSYSTDATGTIRSTFKYTLTNSQGITTTSTKTNIWYYKDANPLTDIGRVRFQVASNNFYLDNLKFYNKVASDNGLYSVETMNVKNSSNDEVQDFSSLSTDDVLTLNLGLVKEEKTEMNVLLVVCEYQDVSGVLNLVNVTTKSVLLDSTDIYKISETLDATVKDATNSNVIKCFVWDYPELLPLNSAIIID